MTSDPRGLAVIISNQYFIRLKTREGAECDLKMLCSLFTQLKFKVEKLEGLSAEVSLMRFSCNGGSFLTYDYYLYL